MVKDNNNYYVSFFSACTKTCAHLEVSTLSSSRDSEPPTLHATGHLCIHIGCNMCVSTQSPQRVHAKSRTTCLISKWNWDGVPHCMHGKLWTVYVQHAAKVGGLSLSISLYRIERERKCMERRTRVAEMKERPSGTGFEVHIVLSELNHIHEVADK